MDDIGAPGACWSEPRSIEEGVTAAMKDPRGGSRCGTAGSYVRLGECSLVVASRLTCGGCIFGGAVILSAAGEERENLRASLGEGAQKEPR